MILLQSYLAVMRFALELALVALYGWFGFRLGSRLVPGLDWFLGIGLPLALVATWGAFVAPRASRRLPDPARLLLELVLFTIGAAMLFLTNRAIWGALLFVAFALDRLLLDRLGKPAWAEPVAGRPR